MFYLDKTIQYVYNGIGNIESVTTTGSTGTTSTQSFTYGDSANPDRLTKFGTKAIAYNAIGCPTSYNGKSFTWSKGKLASVSSGALPLVNTYTYTYDAMGRIASVTTDGKLTSYQYDAYGQLIKEETKNASGTIDKTTQYVYVLFCVYICDAMCDKSQI